MGNKPLAKVIEMEDYRPVWTYGEAFCRACANEWVAICHKDNTDKLECANCGKMTGQLKKENAC